MFQDDAPNNKHVKWLTQKELMQRTIKGICWYCDEKWHKGHHCKKKIFLVGPALVDTSQDDGDEDDRHVPPRRN